MVCVLSEYYQGQLLLAGEEHVVSGNFSGPLYGAIINLFTNDLTPTPQTPFVTWTLPIYAAYAGIAAAFGVPYRRSEGGIAVDSAFVQFQETSTISTATCYGYVIYDAAGTNWISAELFPGGYLQLVDALSAIAFVAQLALGGPDYGSMALSN
jgi:hypothetical protein